MKPVYPVNASSDRHLGCTVKRDGSVTGTSKFEAAVIADKAKSLYKRDVTVVKLKDGTYVAEKR